MKFEKGFETSIVLPPADNHVISSLHAIDADRAVMRCITMNNFDPVLRQRDPMRLWVIELTRSGTQMLEIPEKIRTIPAKEPGSPREDVSELFTLDGQIGILQSDSRIHLFNSIKAKSKTIAIVNPFAQISPSWGGKKLSYIPVRCGKAAGNQIPVVFRHPESDEFAGYFSVLEIDAAAGTARWLAINDKTQSPMHIKYLRDKQSYREEYQLGPFLDDLAWDGKRLKSWAIGENRRLKYGMTYCALLQSDMKGTKASVAAEIKGECFGKLLPEGYAILTPRTKSGPRKGAQSILNLQTRAEEALELPRGMSKLHLLDAADGVFWAVKGGKWSGQGSAAPAKAGQGFSVVGLRADS